MAIVLSLALSLAITLGLLILLVSLLPLINWAAYPGMYRPLLQGWLNRSVHCRNLRVSLIPRFRLRMEVVTIGEDPSFGETPFITLSGLDWVTSWRSLIVRRSEGTRLVLRNPSLAIVFRSAQGMNLETLAQFPSTAFEGSTRSRDKASLFTALCALLGVRELVVSGGVVTVEELTKNKREPRQTFTRVQGHLGRPGRRDPARMRVSARSDGNTWTATGSFRTRDKTCDIERLEVSCLRGRTIGSLTGTLLPSLDLAVDAPILDARDLKLLPSDGPEVQAVNVRARLWTQAPGHHLFQIAAGVFHGRLSAEGRIVAPRMLPLHVDAVFQDIRFEELFQLVESRGLRITGKARLSLHLRTRQRSGSEPVAPCEGSGRLHITDGTLGGVTLLEEAAAVLDAGGGPWWPMRFSSLEAEFTLGADAIRITTMHVQGKGLRSTSVGEIHFDRTVRLQTDLQLSEALSRSLARKARVVEHGVQHGWLSLPLILTGTLDRPVARLDKEALGVRAREQLRDQVARWRTRGKGPLRSGESSWKETLWKMFRRSSDDSSGEPE